MCLASPMSCACPRRGLFCRHDGSRDCTASRSRDGPGAQNTFPRSADPRGGTRGISKMYGTPRLILTCCMAPGLSLLECPRDSPGPRVRDDPIVVRDVRGAKERPPTDVGQGRSRRASPARQAPTRGRAEAPLLPAELSAGARPKVPEGRHEWRRKWPISSTTPARSEPPRDFSATRT
jgi:hypothetical protein